MQTTASAAANDNPIAGALQRRGLSLARVSGRDVDANARALSGYRQYIKDYPEDAKRYGIRQPHELSEGQLVLVAIENREPWVYLLYELMTASERRRMMQHVATLDVTGLPDIARAAEELRTLDAAADAAATIQADLAETGLTVGVLAKRWGYSRQGVQKLTRLPDFPPPRFIFNRSRVRIWAVEDIEAFERERPELHSAAAKRLKRRRFAWAHRQRRRGQDAR